MNTLPLNHFSAKRYPVALALSLTIHGTIIAVIITLNTWHTPGSSLPPVFTVISLPAPLAAEPAPLPRAVRTAQPKLAPHPLPVPVPATQPVAEPAPLAPVAEPVALPANQESLEGTVGSAHAPLSESGSTRADNGIYDSDALSLALIKTHAPQPPYPLRQRDQGITGNVAAILVIDTLGKVTTVDIVSATDPAFARTTQQTLVKWRFKPVVYQGRKIVVKRRQEIEFALEEF